MNELKIFEHAQFGQVRTVTKDGEPWFVGKDVAEILGYKNTKDAIIAHVDDEDKWLIQRSDISTIENHIPKDVFPVNLVNGEIPNRGLMAINESGLYSLVISSKLPSAKQFKRWITHEVLPAIRKTGGYVAGEETMTDDELLSRALEVMRQKLEQREARIRNLGKENSRLAVENQIAAPKADYFDELVDRNLLTSFRETAKELNVKERAFVGFLIDKKYIYRDKKGKLMPYETKNSGLFEVKECFNEKTKWSGTQTMITPKGRETFRLLMQGL